MALFLAKAVLVFLAVFFLTSLLVTAFGGLLLGLLAVVGWIKQNSPWYGPLLGAALYFLARESHRYVLSYFDTSFPWLFQRSNYTFSVMYWYGRVMGLGTFYPFAKHLLHEWAWKHWVRGGSDEL